MVTQLDDVGFEFLREQEGLVLHPYKDQVGIWTIGYGSTRYENGEHVKQSDPNITVERAKELFANTSKQFADAVHYWTVPVLNQNQFNALFSFCYNIGTTGFKGSTVLRLINAGVTDKTLKNAFCMWDKADGQVLEDLLERRKKEYALYVS